MTSHVETPAKPSASPFEQAVMAALEDIVQRLHRMEERQALSVVKESYTVEEAAERLERAEWTVRQWCNKGQAKATKIRGRGRKGEWRISHDELVPLQNEGPLPEAKPVLSCRAS